MGWGNARGGRGMGECESNRRDGRMRGEWEGWGNARGVGGMGECEGSRRDGGMQGESEGWRNVRGVGGMVRGKTGAGVHGKEERGGERGKSAERERRVEALAPTRSTAEHFPCLNSNVNINNPNLHAAVCGGYRKLQVAGEQKFRKMSMKEGGQELKKTRQNIDRLGGGCRQEVGRKCRHV